MMGMLRFRSLLYHPGGARSELHLSSMGLQLRDRFLAGDTSLGVIGIRWQWKLRGVGIGVWRRL